MDAARVALAEHVDWHRPLRDVSINGYGAVHATVWAEEKELIDWFRAEHDTQVPGALLFYVGQ